VFENRVLKRVFGPKREEVARGFVAVCFTGYCWCDLVGEGGMGEHGRCVQSFGREAWGEGAVGDLCVGERAVLDWISGRWSGGCGLDASG